jgi:cytochrome c peroxidase
MKRVVLILSFVIAGCGGDEERSPEPSAEAAPQQPPRPLRELVGTVFEPLPETVEINREKMLLGRSLFHENALSGDGTVSCATCHMLSHGGAEPRATSTGIRGQVGPINAPTVLNSEHNFVQFWDGRAANLLEQAAGPVGNPIEMGGEWPTILERLRANEAYVTGFRALYGDAGITQEYVLECIVEYERSLSTPAPFDRWLRGQDDALNEEQQRGLRLFVDTGCTTCHRGRNVGGDSYQRMGLVNNYFERRGGRVTEADLGRFNVTHAEEDRHKFKVPTLRNVALTAPYFHDGSERELAGAVRTMAYVQLGRELSEADAASIVAFLGSLTGELPADARPSAPSAPSAPAAP